MILALLLIADTGLLVAANNQGLGGDAPLSFAESDAEAVARAFEDVSATRVIRHMRATAASTLAALQAMPASDTAIVYLSSHGDHEGLHLGGTLLRWRELRAALERLPARLVVVFVDACQSGALLTAKGFVQGPPLNVTLTPSGPKGHLLITSSGAFEQSNESRFLGGSPFTQALVSALRGAADADHDGAVSVSEAYHFVYAATLAGTLAARTGPQHPSALLDTHGAGDAVLCHPARAGLVVRQRQASAEQCYLLDAEQTTVLAELGSEPLHLGKRELWVKCVSPRGVRVARVPSGASEIVVDDLHYEDAPRLYALAKGADQVTTHGLSLAGGVSIAGRVRPLLLLRYRGGTRVLGAHAQVMSDERVLLITAGVGYRLPWLSFIEVGLQLAGGYNGSAVFGVGQFVAADVPLHDRLALAMRADLLQLLLPAPQFMAVFSLGLLVWWPH